ncbi:NAD(P)H-binding protein [Winogradskya humida]|uniref:Nucleoside-diphosphate-sugar epimerase n=1 Tax=Winogradskya humida TaxID=113566 RepID=A0ABQ3ZG07_9ACTN|nr:NAD(P)H-binding protein [Actinoplanes humidus]GIE17506.1 hypothetical protein Ahu01nite_006080 [Actinoplanes humidus]
MSDIKQALVIGATGNIGAHVVTMLGERGVSVRALARNPVGLPEGVTAVRADVRDLDALRAAVDGTEAVFLVWPFMSADGIEDVAAILGSEQGRRVVYVSAMSVRDDRPAVQNGVWGQVEDAVRRSGASWTFLRASGFATNTLAWAAAIAAGRPVRIPYPEAARSLIHERDIAAVAVRALTEPGHEGTSYALTGPAAITQREQIHLIGAAAGAPVRIEEASRDEARAEMLQWADPAFADGALDYWASLVDTPEPVTRTVAELTGGSARSFAQWAQDHAADFRPSSTAAVAERFVRAFRAGRMDLAYQLAAPGLVRVAPIEGTELHGLAEIMANGERLTRDLRIHDVAVQGPLIGDEHQFAVRFVFDQTHLPTGRRATTAKISLYTVTGGEIVREEVHYFDPPL